MKGSFNYEHNDYEVRLLIRCGRKERYEPASGELALLLAKLGLDQNVYYRDLKKAIWRYLGLENPVLLPMNEGKTILQKVIDNAGEVRILRDSEGHALSARLGLGPGPDKRELERRLISAIMGSNEADGRAVDKKRPEVESSAPTARRFTGSQETETLSTAQNQNFDSEAIGAAIRKSRGNIGRAAQMLRLKRNRLSQLVAGDLRLKAILKKSRTER
jgi:hypothetical protein